MKTIVAFHIGRGGRFNNQGHVSYIGEKNISDLLSLNDNSGNWSFLRNKDEKGRFCRPFYADQNGTHLIYEDEVKTGVGRLEWDTDYDTDYCCHLEDCSETELRLILEDSSYKSYEVECFLKDYFKDELETEN